MKKQIWIPLLIFSVLLSACNFGFAEEQEPRERLDVSVWPTPVSPTPTAQPTPFPMTTLAPTSVSASVAEVEEATATPEAEAEIAQLIPGGVTTELIQEVSNLTGGLAPVAVFKVSDDEIGVRQGPGTNYGVNSTLGQGELGGILGQDSSGQWVFVLTITRQQGWLPLSSIRVVGTLDEAPTLPPDPIGALMQQAQAAAAGGTSSSGSTSTNNQTLDFAGLESVASAKISSDLINLRQRPGPNYKLLGSLAGNTPVEVYGLNRDKEWALIKTADGQFAWASMDYLDVDGSLAQAPQFRTLEPGAGHPANQAAPMIDATGAPVAIAAVQTNGSSQNTIPAASTSSSDGLPSNTLAPKGTATVNTKVDMLTGPASNFGPVDTLTIDQPVTILATNEFGDWVLVQTVYSNIGWVPLDTLTVDGPPPGVSPVLTARVTSNELSLRSGPAIFYDEVGVAAINTVVSVIGLNEGKSWTLIESVNGSRGWIPTRLLEVYGTLDGVPTASAPELADNTPTEQLPAPSSGPPAGKLLIQTSSGGDVISINADGSNLSNVTTGIDPVLSPNGQQIAFTRWGSGDVGTLYIANADGSGERAILGEMRKAKGPDWSPDGNQIILNFQQGGRVTEERTCAEGDRRPPSGAFDIRVDVNDEGEIRLCYTLPPDPNWSLRLVDLDDGNYADKYGGLYAFRPTFDPARPWRVVSAAGNGLLATDINRDDYRQQVTDIIGDGSPAFSPDGRYIAVTTESNGVQNIYRMNADGGNRVQLTDTPLWVAVEPGSNQKQWNHVAPVWSPDGARIAFLTDRNGGWEVWVMNADGSNPQPMFSDEINERLNIDYNFVDERVLDWQ